MGGKLACAGGVTCNGSKLEIGQSSSISRRFRYIHLRENTLGKYPWKIPLENTLGKHQLWVYD